MEDQTFEQLAAEAASGLKADRELYLEVTQELRTHLEAKADKLQAQGHAEEESIAEAKKAFGSPLDMAADLLEANRPRMKWHALARLAFGALIVPLAIVLALYVGYGRFARLQVMNGYINEGSAKLPTLPFFGFDTSQVEGRSTIIRQWQGRAEGIHQYWQTHRDDPDSYMYYANYALFVDGQEAEYAAAMRQGERLEPDNALYNILLANYYLKSGMTARSEKNKNEPQTDDLHNIRSFESGIVELQKAVEKPYLRTYHMEILRKQLDSLPEPLLTEDYIQRIAVASAILFPECPRYRQIAWQIPGCARILLSEGRRTDSEAIMDTWRPYMQLLSTDSNSTMIQALVTRAVGGILTKEGTEVYDRLGAHEKARVARSTDERLKKAHDAWNTARKSGSAKATDDLLRQHGVWYANILFPVFGNTAVTAAELTPGRMHEHTMLELMTTQALLALLALALLGTLLQGAIWFYRLRRASSAPLLLMPPAKEVARALLLGIALPMVLYWLYSRTPVLGGREYGWSSTMMPRFAVELLALLIIVRWLPVHLIRRHIRQRCDDLGIALPTAKEERKASRLMWTGIVIAFILFVLPAFIMDDMPPSVETTVVLVSLGIIIVSVIRAGHMRQSHGLYFGTLARSITTIYAFAILFISVTIQPFLLYQEAQWLRRDTTMYGYLADRNNDIASLTLTEARAAKAYTKQVMEALHTPRSTTIPPAP